MTTETKRKRGAQPATGRFDTRAELCEEIWRSHRFSPAKVADIARKCRVSTYVVNKILNTREGLR